jgi:predicted AlkP superfamily phosphohydrolase/phosphomutase
MARFFADGATAPLRSTIPPVTPLAWSSLITGTNPGRHGIFGFLKRRSGTYNWYPTSAAGRQGLSFWEWAGRYGCQVGVYNMPMTYPPQPVLNGYMISGMGVPDVDVRFTSPEALQDEILLHFSPEQLVEQPISLFNQETYIDYLLQTVDDNLAITKYLLQKYPNTDILCSVFTATDRVQHFYWQQMLDSTSPPNQRSAIESVYRRIDSALANLMESFPSHTFLIISDHGAGPYSHLININRWLAEKGWLSWQNHQNDTDTRSKPIWKSLYQRLGRTATPAMRRRLKALIPSGAMARIRSQMGHWSPAVDWSATSAYSASFGGNIYLNLDGREPQGIIQPGQQADSILENIAAELREMKDPDNGEKIVKHVHYRKDLYKGMFVSEAPDLVVEWNDGYYSMAGFGESSSGVFQGQLRWPDSDAIHSAEHHLFGILLARNPSVVRNIQLEEANIIDIAPTLLHLLNLPIPSSMEGDVLIEMFDTDVMPEPIYTKANENASDQEQPVYSESEEEEILRQLKDLGYLD